MPNYPSSPPSFTTKNTGEIIQAGHVNALQDEVAAIGGDLIQGLKHHLIPDQDNVRDVGSATKRWKDAHAVRVIAPTVGPSTSQQHTLPTVTSDTVALLNATQTLANKTLTTPTISNFTNAQHAHTNAASGGQIAHSSLTGIGPDDHHARVHGLNSSDHTGQLATAQLEDNAVTNAKLRDSSALSVIGRSSHTAGDPGDIVASVSGAVLMRVPGIPNDYLGFAKVDSENVDENLLRRSIVLVVPGNPAAGTNVTIRFVCPQHGSITAIKSTCRVAPTSTYTYDINKNGSTIYTTQSNRPTRTAGNGTGLVTHAAPDITSIGPNDIIDVDLDVAGSGISDTTFFIEYLII